MKAAAVFVSFFVCLALLCVGFVLSRFWPTRDSNGNDPSGVAGLFIQAVNRKDFALAKTYWEDGAVDNIEFLSPIPFAEFCEKTFTCSSYSVTRPVKQKADSWNLEFQGENKGRPVSYVFYVRKTDGTWRLQYSLPYAR
jgi:hypothetical protein